MTASWNEQIAGLPNTHLLQTREWGAIKKPLGWVSHQLIWQKRLDNPDRVSMHAFQEKEAPFNLVDGKPPAAAALLLVRQFSVRGIPTPFKLAYSPKGPLLNWGDRTVRSQVLQDLTDYAGQTGAFLLKIDPDVLVGTGIPGNPEAVEDPVGREVLEALTAGGWFLSEDQIQFRNTVVIGLQADEEALLKKMKQKTRYNIRLAARKGVVIRRGDLSDLELLYGLYAETSVRDGFVIRNEAYYHNVWTTFMKGPNGSLDQPTAMPLIAEVDGKAVAAVIIFRFAKKAWFLFGMSGAAHRKLMPNYLLQWEAVKYAKAAGCTHYDMWGAPDEFSETDSLWGVFRFKRGFQGEVVRTVGAWDLPLRPLQYRLYTNLLPAILNMMRRWGKTKTERSLAPL